MPFRLPFFRRQPQVPPRYLIVGLGNPGAQYASTRHNVGFRVLELLAERHKIVFKGVEKRSMVAYGEIEEQPVVLAKPLTFMNLSGESIAPLLRTLELTPQDLLVVVDEMDLPVGKIRLRPGGSAGGHNGLKSLVQHLRTEEFPRLRLGVGRPSGGATVDHVLSKFTRAELEPIREGIEGSADAVEAILRDGLEAAMNRFNQK